MKKKSRNKWTVNNDEVDEGKRKIKPMIALQIIVLSLTFICLLLNLLCMFGASWLHFDESTERFKDHHVYFGVARICRTMLNKRNCHFRGDLFRFKYMTNRNGVCTLFFKRMLKI